MKHRLGGVASDAVLFVMVVCLHPAEYDLPKQLNFVKRYCYFGQLVRIIKQLAKSFFSAPSPRNNVVCLVVSSKLGGVRDWIYHLFI